MPRNIALDHERVLAVYQETGSKAETARRLGLHYNSVWKALKAREGYCSRCTRIPVSDGHGMCESCRTWMREQQTKRRASRKTTGLCQLCDKPAITRRFCEDHREGINANARMRRVINKAKHGEMWLARIRAYNRRQKYGEAANTVWDRHGGGCALCGRTYSKRAIHVHHIDGDHGNRDEKNLIPLCVKCHRLVHALISHPSPDLVIDWVAVAYARA